jgi:hypothetical protein
MSSLDDLFAGKGPEEIPAKTKVPAREPARRAQVVSSGERPIRVIVP